MQPEERITRCDRPPEKVTVLFDGHCRFCVGSSKKLGRLARGELELRSFREEGVLERFHPLGLAQCEKAMQLIDTDGHIVEGAEAVVAAVQGRWFGPIAKAYYVPGIRQVSDALYGWVARNRFRISGQTCTDGTCRLH